MIFNQNIKEKKNVLKNSPRLVGPYLAQKRWANTCWPTLAHNYFLLSWANN